MTFPVATADAKRRQLPGSDTYRSSHVFYLDDLHRDWGAVRLNIEAVKAFSDTVEISQRDALAAHRAELEQWLAKGGLTADLQFPWSEASHDALEYVNYENLKIACGFELHLKARVLARDFVIHRIDRSMAAYRTLAREQEDRPVSTSEVLAIQGFHFDGTVNCLPGLSSASVKFSWLTDKPKYRAALGLTDQQLDIVRDFRQLRNQIHLPSDGIVTPAISSFGAPIVEFLLPFINTEIVAWSNRIITARKFGFKPIPRSS